MGKKQATNVPDQVQEIIRRKSKRQFRRRVAFNKHDSDAHIRELVSARLQNGQELDSKYIRELGGEHQLSKAIRLHHRLKHAVR